MDAARWGQKSTERAENPLFKIHHQLISSFSEITQILSKHYRFIGKYYKKKNSSGSPVTSLLSPPLGSDDLRVRFKQQSVPEVEGYLSGGDPLLVRLTSVQRTALSLLHVPFSSVTQM